MLLDTYIHSHAFIHTLYSVKLLRLKPRRGRERESGPEHPLEESWASFRLTLNKKCERLRLWGRVNIKMWVVTSARDYSARPLERVCGVRVVCKLAIPATSFILYRYLLCVCLSSCVLCFPLSLSTVLNVHSSIVGSKYDVGPHTDWSWGFSSGPIRTLVSSVHSK